MSRLLLPAELTRRRSAGWDSNPIPYRCTGKHPTTVSRVVIGRVTILWTQSRVMSIRSVGLEPTPEGRLRLTALCYLPHFCLMLVCELCVAGNHGFEPRTLGFGVQAAP